MEQNCWEFKKCGRNIRNDLGICPAVTELKADGLNRGKNGGRICWSVAGTYCYNKVQGTYAEKVLLCCGCGFREKVREEEGVNSEIIYFKPGIRDEQGFVMRVSPAWPGEKMSR